MILLKLETQKTTKQVTNNKDFYASTLKSVGQEK